MNEIKRVKMMNSNIVMFIDEDFNLYMPYNLEVILEHLKKVETIDVYNFLDDYFDLPKEKSKKIGYLKNFELLDSIIYGDLTFIPKRIKRFIKEIDVNKRLFSQFNANILEKENGLKYIEDIKNFKCHVYGYLQKIEKI